MKQNATSFKLDAQKKVMPYRMYTQPNITRQYLPILEAIHHVSGDDREQLIQNIDKWDCKRKEHTFHDFYIIRYNNEYCNQIVHCYITGIIFSEIGC